MTGRFSIAGREVGASTAPFIIAEAGVHHANDVAIARRLVVEAARAGADAVKFQTYDASKLAARWAPTYWASEPGLTQHDIFRDRSRLGESEYRELFECAAGEGITLLSTPFDLDALALLLSSGMPAVKIASADLTFVPLLDAAAASGLPVLLSTGAATFDEIDAAVERLSRGAGPVALLHCVLSYPTPFADANLRRIPALQARFPEHVIGYSDHTQWSDTTVACPLAVALGARIVEKHFTLDRALPGDDHYHAVDPAGLSQLVKECRQAAAMTDAATELRATEQPARDLARRSAVAARSLAKGTILREDDLAFKRPGTGLPPTRAHEVIGRRLLRDLEDDALVLPADVE